MGTKARSDIFGSEGVFAAANSAGGFKSYYDRVFDRERLERLYIIKGGPGTGKNRFMEDAARYAESKGYSVERYKCSSDPDSLDGVIIDGRVAMIDGTAPHTAEPEVAGARDEIVNLGVFWDGVALAERGSEIRELNEGKRVAYAKGYKYLSACGALSDANDLLLYPTIKGEKLVCAANRIVNALPAGVGGEAIPALFDSVGMKGRIKLDAYSRCADKLYLVIDWFSTAHLFLKAVRECAHRRGIPMRISFDPVNTERLNGVYLCNSRTSFVAVSPLDVREREGVRVNMKRFIDKAASDGIKREYRNNLKLYDALMSSACDAFEEAGEYHFELEKIYVSCMDFAAKEKYTASFCEMLVSQLSPGGY